MTQADLKEASPDSSSIPAQISGPPPYDPVAHGGNDDDDAGMPAVFTARPGNNIIISRACGALRGMRFTVDPNIHLPKSLLRPQQPEVNLDLKVDFGGIDAEVDVLPLLAPPPQEDNSSPEDYPRQKKIHLKARTLTGNLTLRVNAPPATPIVLNVGTDFGRVRVYLPRTMHGPLTFSSAVRTPCLSPALRRVCMPLREEGNKTHYFVGDIGAWTAKDEMGDEVTVTSDFGHIWVGYVGEEEEIPHVQPRSRFQLGLRAVGVILLPWTLYWILASM